MIVSVKTTISFQLPEENDLAEFFQADNDLSKWHMDLCTAGVTFTRSDTYGLYGRKIAKNESRLCTLSGL